MRASHSAGDPSVRYLESAPFNRRMLFGIGCSALAILTLAACGGGQDEEVSTEADESGNQSETQVDGPPILGPVVWATSIVPGTSEPASAVSSFPVDTFTMYATFPVERLALGVVIQATWLFNGQTIDGVGAELTAPRDQVGGWLEFHLDRTSDEPWPDGEYGISLSTGNVLIATGSVPVVRP